MTQEQKENLEQFLLGLYHGLFFYALFFIWSLF